MPNPRRDTEAKDSIRAEYEAHGSDAFYREQGAGYSNPHEAAVRASLTAAIVRWQPKLDHVLDLAAGSGEATLLLRELGALAIDGIDAFTHVAYERRTGSKAERFTFDDVAGGALVGRHYTLVVCSYALHLCELSKLPRVVQQLSLVGESLLIVTPHKRPAIRAEWGWTLSGELMVQRARSRFYLSRHDR